MSSWSPFLPIINAEGVSQAAEHASIVVVLLWAIWDPASRSLDAWLRQFSEDYTNLHFYAMDSGREQNWPLAREWGVLTTPTLVCLFNGVLHERFAGSMPEPLMRAKLEDWASLNGKQSSESRE